MFVPTLGLESEARNRQLRLLVLQLSNFRSQISLEHSDASIMVPASKVGAVLRELDRVNLSELVRLFFHVEAVLMREARNPDDRFMISPVWRNVFILVYLLVKFSNYIVEKISPFCLQQVYFVWHCAGFLQQGQLLGRPDFLG